MQPLNINLLGDRVSIDLRQGRGVWDTTTLRVLVTVLTDWSTATMRLVGRVGGGGTWGPLADSVAITATEAGQWIAADVTGLDEVAVEVDAAEDAGGGDPVYVGVEMQAVRGVCAAQA